MDNLWICENGGLGKCATTPEALAELKTMNDPKVATLGYRKQAVTGNVQLGPFVEIFQLTSMTNAEKLKLPIFIVVVNGSFSVMATVLVHDFPSLLDLLNHKLVFLS
jgi:hypothetical protein